LSVSRPTADPRYPVGRYQAPPAISAEQRRAWIDQIAAAPRELREAVQGLSELQLDTPYRDGGWSVRQVVHHVSDSHMNGFVRFKLGLTEDSATIRTFDERAWACLADVRSTPVEVSLELLEALHIRWVAVLRSLEENQWTRSIRHAEYGEVRLDVLLGLYEWHGRHHVAHVISARERMRW
jgi:hypothetical protein